MSFKLPTTDQLRQVGEEIGLDLTRRQESALYRAADAFERAGDWQKIGTKGSSRTSRKK
jgi:hypothetical protein